ncbi:TonB C-terminal domain-containing protein [Janthinobacterium fluminis]|uniref:TonB C-terminal domain-containing protein n=1 Tax=Janthinobacterium fluminis TaxID=2987524 RepID=A0ABT5K6R8_9BURK|nr:TonB C-terminal domain-containing protein [Janthinobacterium fluminis]MDC8760700.1 TonB C-terminal domain-containing protein [Janthinobacterium fluminis]
MSRAMKKLLVPASLGLFALLLSACQKGPPRVPPTPTTGERPPVAVAAPTPAAPADSIEQYKALVAQQILDANPSITFSGRLPPMLPAIVVVNISVDRDGGLSAVVVKRSRDSEASKVALAAVRRVAAPFPKPLHLLHRSHKTLEFSETFLFNELYQFQLRSLAGPQ